MVGPVVGHVGQKGRMHNAVNLIETGTLLNDSNHLSMTASAYINYSAKNTRANANSTLIRLVFPANLRCSRRSPASRRRPTTDCKEMQLSRVAPFVSCKLVELPVCSMLAASWWQMFGSQASVGAEDVFCSRLFHITHASSRIYHQPPETCCIVWFVCITFLRARFELASVLDFCSWDVRRNNS